MFLSFFRSVAVFDDLFIMGGDGVLWGDGKNPVSTSFMAFFRERQRFTNVSQICFLAFFRSEAVFDDLFIMGEKGCYGETGRIPSLLHSWSIHGVFGHA